VTDPGSRSTSTSGEQQAVTSAFALGWQVAELFHSPVHEEPAVSPSLDDLKKEASKPSNAGQKQLPGLSAIRPAMRAVVSAERIQTLAEQLCPMPQGGTDPLDGAPQKVLDVLKNPDRKHDGVLEAVLTLHCQLLYALSVADFRLGRPTDSVEP
jgi:hypothetical protein